MRGSNSCFAINPSQHDITLKCSRLLTLTSYTNIARIRATLTVKNQIRGPNMSLARLVDVRRIEFADRQSGMALWGTRSSSLLLSRLVVEAPRTGPLLRRLPEELRELPELVQVLQ